MYVDIIDDKLERRLQVMTASDGSRYVLQPVDENAENVGDKCNSHK